MSVLSYRELTGRDFTHRFGEAPTAARKFGVTLDTPATSTQEILNAIGIFHGAFHPEYSFLRCTEGAVKEATPTPYHAEVTYRYESPKLGNAEFEPNPLARRDVWSFSPTSTTVPALTYYEGVANEDVQPLTNTAGDYFEGLTVESSEMRAIIAGNRAVFPVSLANAVTNTINSGEYLGSPAYTWKCQGVGAQQRTEVVNDIEITYWEVTVELLYRPQTWLLKLPNIGFNYLPGGTGDKAPVHVRDNATESPTYGQDVPSQAPLPLQTDGDLKTSGDPDILERRPYALQDFASYFGTPPF
jgi:hypothetical protein